MSDIWLLYWFTRLDMLHALFVFIGITGGIALIVNLLSILDGLWDISKKWFFLPIGLMLFGTFGAIFLPTQKEAAIILAGSTVLQAAKSETAGRLAGKSVQLIEQTLDAYLKKEDKK